MAEFTHLRLQNWRNFRKVDVALQRRVFIVGANASGKSNLLDVFRFLQELAVEGGGLTNALHGSNRGGLRAIRSLHAGGDPKVGIRIVATIDNESWTYELDLAETKEGAQVAKEVVTRAGAPVLTRPDSKDKKDPELLRTTALEQSASNGNFRLLRDFFRSSTYVHVVPQLLRIPSVGDSERFGKGLGTGLIGAMGEVPKKTREARLRRIQNALLTVLPQFDELEWMQDSKGIPHLRAKYKHWRRTGAWQQETSFSDGTLRLIGLLWYLDQQGGPLLLEEPEISLHAAAVRQLPQIFAGITARKRRQIIVTSHATELLQEDSGVNPNELLLLTTTDKETTVTSGDTDREICAAAEGDRALKAAVDAATRPPKVADLGLFGSK
jgi:predicted ATPase